ncbi:GH17560 [Drosophila grimshawi]|uniref:GH17560 n=1 Tax=Drosophila grimshawi TaxID=7222 RepID=B4JXJ4_DROGR|nr:GH17560 [Drosophila grimshawi]
MQCNVGYPPEHFDGQDQRRCNNCLNKPAKVDNIPHNIDQLVLENTDVMSNQRMDEARNKCDDIGAQVEAHLKTPEEPYHDYLINDFMSWFKTKHQIESDDADIDLIVLDKIFSELPKDDPSIRMALRGDPSSIAAMNTRKEEYMARMYSDYENEMSLAKKTEVVEKVRELSNQKTEL